jgi:hypothetical protein
MQVENPVDPKVKIFFHEPTLTRSPYEPAWIGFPEVSASEPLSSRMTYFPTVGEVR